ncbi:PREDICTED: uncharacterized protein LOC108560911 isoform X1 [Nicrophorus vespilloides]|uniref:Uncharacterized protein LOC108560911 isoform X1 n=1 Tax=Nicrophorus vespilloides TaxID=110193 RepID=A0ABM1MHS0_NICVS|nr:PREDICTED: uncharacterized protein LOC108560911 isoform X1 [Nicrophorus vespilloides]
MHAIKRVCSQLHPNRVPNRLRGRSRPKRETLDPIVGAVEEELEVPQASEIVFRKKWRIKKFHKTIAKRDSIDSPVFHCSVNGVTTSWNISIRFWKGPNGKKVLNPLVVCLNLTGCETEEMSQARVRFQFGVWDANIRHWECCPIANVVLNLENTQELLSVGYKSLGILDRHIDNDNDVSILVKIQIIQTEEERHNLSQDLARIMNKTGDEYVDTLVECGVDPEDILRSDDSLNSENSRETNLKVNSLIIKARSPMLAVMLMSQNDNDQFKYKLDLKEINYSLVKELFRYMYTDKVDGIDALCGKLLSLSVKFCIPGLQTLCERALLETITPNNVANILLLADQCKCESLRKAALHYCEDSDTIKDNAVIGKTLAWRVMEMVNPELFLEACESINSSSSNLDSPSTPGSYSDFDV